VTTGSGGSLWSRFEHDPRDPAYAGMRASDRDRAVVHDALAEAYAEGRIDREELDERTTAVDVAKAYADLVAPLQDLTSDASPLVATPAPAGDVQRAAEQHYRDKLRETFFEFLIPNLICWAIWFMTGHDGFIWPVFVTIPTLLHLLQVASSKHRTIQAQAEKLARKQAKALEPPKQKPAKSDADSILRDTQEKPEEA
jgi:uncharacterized protein DUF1707